MSTVRSSKPSNAKPKPTARPPVQTTGQQSLLDLAIWVGLLIVVFAVYAQVGKFEFVAYDDNLTIYDNSFVKAGLTPASIKWAFTAIVVSNWMPVTLLSHMLDCQLFGLASGMHHLVNVLLHALSSVLLFLLLHRATRARWPSAFVAFLFALHPLHVESVAWVVERKDVLSTFFWFLALYAYVRYSERPGVGRYLLVVAPFCIGLMSKPMLVTFPFTLLLFDIWPLRRLQWPRIVWEKLPLFALSAAAASVTYFVQGTHGAFILTLPLATRLKNALNSYLIYIVQTVRPIRLSAIYSFQMPISTWSAVAALLILLAITALVIFAWRWGRPYYAVGWFWYLGTLVPVIGLVQIGYTSHADRYTYIPLIGLAVIAAWGAMDAARKWPWLKSALAPAALCACVACILLTSAQAAYWHDTETLFQHAIAVTQDNWVAHYNLGEYDISVPARGCKEAILHFEATLRIRPDHISARDALGSCLATTGRPTEALPYLERNVRAQPESPDLQASLGEALSRIIGREAEAIPHLQAALRLKPDNPDIINDLAACLLNTGRPAQAVPYFEKAARLKPNSPDIQLNLALALSRTPARAAEAIPHYEAALRLKPDYADAHRSLGLLLARNGRNAEAIAHLTVSQQLQPDPEIAKTIAILQARGK